MPGTLTLEVVAGASIGKQFEFEEHDTFVFGRTQDCQIRLPKDDCVSRHHFILEVNPPDARIRDLGSLNGTYVNGAKHGGRDKTETPEEGAKQRYPEVDIKNGDRIKVGKTIISVHVPAACCECGCEIQDQDRNTCAQGAGVFFCRPCWAKFAAIPKPSPTPPPAKCARCGRDASKEIGEGRQGQYVCASCCAKVQRDPAQLLQEMMAKATGIQQSQRDIVGYQIERVLGQGGMGVVYLARHTMSNRQVALKVMLSRVAVDEKSRKAFQREVDTTRSLRHPHVIEFIDHGSACTAFYFIMEFCEGGSVDGLMARHGGRLPLQLARPIMLQTLEGLAYAHGQKIVHRDLKPPNILLKESAGGQIAKVSDFGLAKSFERAGFSGMTMTGTTAGTPVFMPREQVTNYKHVKPESDVWSIGATFYNMLTGNFPRDMRRGQDPIEAALNAPVVPIRQRDGAIPRRLAEVIDRALAPDVKSRFRDAREMHEALAAAL